MIPRSKSFWVQFAVIGVLLAATRPCYGERIKHEVSLRIDEEQNDESKTMLLLGDDKNANILAVPAIASPLLHDNSPIVSVRLLDDAGEGDENGGENKENGAEGVEKSHDKEIGGDGNESEDGGGEGDGEGGAGDANGGKGDVNEGKGDGNEGEGDAVGDDAKVGEGQGDGNHDGEGNEGDSDKDGTSKCVLDTLCACTNRPTKKLRNQQARRNLRR
jgi:hypothetical protein